MGDITNILVAIDFTDTDKRLLQNAQQWALKFNAYVWIVHVAAPEPAFVGYGPGPQYVRNVRADDLRQEHRTLQAYADSLKSAGLESQALLVPGNTAEMLIEEIQKLKIDMLLMGAHKHGAFDRLFSENHPSQLAVKAGVPVLIVP